MLQLHNHTALASKILTLPDPDGVEALHVLIKATFTLTPDPRLALEQRPVRLVEERVGDGVQSWLRAPSEAHPARPACELLIDGDVVAPGGALVTVLDAGVAVGPFERHVRALGDRQYTGDPAAFCTAPTAFTRMPLTPQRAFGGCFNASGEVEVRNPSGVGFVPAGLRDLRVLRGLPLPNLEDPHDLITQPGDRPAPRWFGAVSAAWSPRVERAGTYDAAWDRTRAPFLPTDFDPAFNMVTPDAMWLPARLVGGERIALRHLAEQPWIESRVPALGLRVRAEYRGQRVDLRAQSELLHLFPDAGVATLLLRATLRCGHRVLDVAAVEITSEGAS